jgi:hypothetical protein
MYGVAVDLVFGPSAVEFDGEQDVGGLGLAVAEHAHVVVAGGEVRVVPADVGEAVAARGHIDDSGAVSGAQGGE